MQRILIVDDHPLYREGMIGALSTHFSDTMVLGAGSAEEGLAMLEANPDVDLVLIDLRLPGMDGMGALAAYGTRFPTVPLMLVSGAEDANLARRAIEAGASGFLPKSLSVGEVAASIRRVLAGSIYVPAAERAPEDPATTGDATARLTLRQLETLRLLGEGFSNKDIARLLQITERTAKAHVAAILEVLGTENRTQAVLAAQRLGLLPVGGA